MKKKRMMNKVGRRKTRENMKKKRDRKTARQQREKEENAANLPESTEKK